MQTNAKFRPEGHFLRQNDVHVCVCERERERGVCVWGGGGGCRKATNKRSRRDARGYILYDTVKAMDHEFYWLTVGSPAQLREKENRTSCK